MKRLLVLAVVAAPLLPSAAPAHATNECRGLQVCVPSPARGSRRPPARRVPADVPEAVHRRRPRRRAVDRGIDIGFRRQRSAARSIRASRRRETVFLGRLRGGGQTAAASFRPHIGCVPASGGGQRASDRRTPVRAGEAGRPVGHAVRRRRGRTGRHVETAALAIREARSSDARNRLPSVTGRRPRHLPAPSEVVPERARRTGYG